MQKIKDFLRLVDFEFTLFGLPFAYLGAFLAIKGMPSVSQLWWITVAMVAARTAALCLNRVIDLPFDAANPRTSSWILPRGRLNTVTVWLAAVVSIFVLVLAASQLNRLCLILSPVAVAALWGYSYTKRFTWWCHLILGLVVGIGPVASWIAVTGQFAWQPGLLWLAVGFWIGGFDTMYACQDIEFDRNAGLFSVPARFGETGGLVVSAVFHALTVILFVASGLVMSLGFYYFTSVAFAGALLLYEHAIVRPGRLDRVNHASFKVNRFVSLIVFVGALLDIL